MQIFERLSSVESIQRGISSEIVFHFNARRCRLAHETEFPYFINLEFRCSKDLVKSMQLTAKSISNAVEPQ